jgi:mannose-6-phosphate isomerase-like protein (cupin superfamily)
MTGKLQSRVLKNDPDAIAPDGSEVRLLANGTLGSMAHFRLPPGAVSKAVCHRTVEELWFVTRGQGRMWRALAGVQEVTALRPGVSLVIAAGTKFQFRCDGLEALECVGVTMPPWPGMEEAFEVTGIW